MTHLVPSLLPDDVIRVKHKADVQPTVLHIAFYTGNRMLQANEVERSYLQRRCSLPAGIFEQVCIYQACEEHRLIAIQHFV